MVECKMCESVPAKGRTPSGEAPGLRVGGLCIMAKRKNHYRPTEKLGVMVMAFRDGIPATSQALNIPETTIRTWFEQMGGGIVEIRRWIDSITVSSFEQAQRAIYEQVVAKAPSLTSEELMTTFRRLAESHLMPVQAQTAQAGASAQTVINVTIPDR